jgi:hypothetical protein
VFAARQRRAGISLPELIDALRRIGDRRVGIRPREAELEGGKQHAIDSDQAQVASLDRGVPKARSGLERLDIKPIIVADHLVPPVLVDGKAKHELAGADVKPVTSENFFAC